MCLASAKADAIASGNWLNVRSFNTDRFNAPPPDGVGRRSTWYYCPQALSEYQIPMLDMGYRLGVSDQLATDASFNSSYSDVLFSGAQPSSTSYGESDSFKHYLQCLRTQSLRSVKPTYEQTKQSVRMQFETASMLTDFLQNNGIRGKNRDFSNVVDSSLAALTAFDKLRGLRLNHRWANL